MAAAIAQPAPRLPLLYALHSGNLYGTERMALATAAGLLDEYEPTMFAPPGPALEAASPMGFGVRPFGSAKEFARQIRPLIAAHRSLAFVATGVVHSLACLAWNLLYRRNIVHLHVVHGGTDERDSYGRKKVLNGFDVVFVAVSHFVKERLVANGVRADRIVVIENFLTPARAEAAPKREPFGTPGVRKIVVVSRVDPIKRIDVLLDAIERDPALRRLEVRVLGTGWQLDELRARANERHPNVAFVGFSPNVADELAAADALVHTCPAEPFGLAILEAMVAGVPVVVPDSGGAGALVDHGVSGFRFSANDPEALAACLRHLQTAPADLLNRVVRGGRSALATRFSPEQRIADYRRLLHGGLP